MRVAVDVTPLLGPITGVGQSVRGLLDALPAVAPDIDVVPWELTRRRTVLPPSVLVRLWARGDVPSGNRWLPDADVVHGTNFVVPPGARPATVTVHDCWCARQPSACSPTVAAATATVRRAVDRGVWLHATTEWGAAEIKEVYDAERVVVVPFGVPGLGPGRPSPIDGPYILALNALDVRKGHADLVRAFALALPAVPGLRLVLAGGGGSASAAVDDAIAATGTAGQIARLDVVDDDQRAALLRGATVLAYPSLYEGFGFPVLESMSVGVPVVATAVGSVTEIAGGAALLSPVGDVDALAASLVRAVTDEAERNRLVAAGQARAATFTWDRHAQGMAALWRTAIEAR